MVTTRFSVCASGLMAAAIWVASSGGWGQDQTGRRAGGAANPAFGLGLGQSGDDGDRECEGLAGAGLAAAEHVAAGEGVGQGGRLDLEGFCLPSAASTFTRLAGTPRIRMSWSKHVLSLSGHAYDARF